MRRRTALVALAFALAACGGATEAGTTTPPAVDLTKPTSISLVGSTAITVGTNQTTTIVAQVRNVAGTAASGVSVTFTASGGTLVAPTATSDANGIASVVWNSGAVMGNQTITAAIPGTSFSAQMVATVAAPTIARLLVAAPTHGFAAANQPATLAFSATTDQGAPAVGATVNFATTGGTFSAASATVDGDGIASVKWTPSIVYGIQTITASSGAATQSLPIYVSSALPASSTITYDGPSVALAGGSILPLPIVSVLDSNGIAVEGAAVTFRVSVGALSAVNPTYTDAHGHASPVTWTLAASAGSQVLTASILGLTTIPTITVSAVTGGSITVASPPELPVGSYLSGTIAGPPGFTTQNFTILEPGMKQIATTSFGTNLSLPFGPYTVAWDDAIGGNPIHSYAPGQAVQTYTLSPTSLTASVQTTWTARH